MDSWPDRRKPISPHWITYTDFDSASGSWHSVASQSSQSNIFTSWNWLKSWWQHFGRDAELHLMFAVEETGEPFGIAPLMRQGDVVRLVGGRALSDYLDVVSLPGREESTVSVLEEALSQLEWQRAEFRGLRKDSILAQTPATVWQRLGWHSSLDCEETCPLLDLPSSWDEYLSSLDKKNRHELRRKMRRLDDAGQWRIEVVTSESMSRADLSDFFTLMRASTNDKRAFLTPAIESFLHEALSANHNPDALRLFFLELGKRRVASALCFLASTELWLYNSGYDPSLSDLSVGVILKSLCVKHAIDNGLKVFDFLRGTEDYKHRLGARDTSIHTLTLLRGNSCSTSGGYADEL